MEVTASSMEDLRPMSKSDPLLTHSIRLIDPSLSPVRENKRRIPPAYRQEFKKMLDEMCAAG